MDETTGTPDPRRWLALAFVSLAQLMVALDATVINIALPSAQRSLHITDPQRQWVITAYTLAFGSLLLLGGRLADTFGRKRTFLAGLVGFAAASAAGGAARTSRSWSRPGRSRARSPRCSPRPCCRCSR